MLRTLPQLARCLPCLVGVAVLMPCAGCYNGQVLVDRARKDALKKRIETVDLGAYQVTMPTSGKQLGMTEVQVEPFGRTARYQIPEIEDAIESNEYLLRHSVMMTIRSSKPEDFADPDLKRLRERLLEAVKESLDTDVIKSVGFHDVRFVRH